MIDKANSSADVGLWLNEHLIRLLYPHSQISMEFRITDEIVRHSSSLTIASWYSAEELLRTVTDIDLILQRQSSTLFCETIRRENSVLINDYLSNPSERVRNALQDHSAQLDAYLMSINDKQNDLICAEKSSKQRLMDIFPPNETREQKQLYEYANRFLPLKERASFPLDEILSSKTLSICVVLMNLVRRFS